MTPLEKIDFVFFYIREKIQASGYWGYHTVWNHVQRTEEAGINKIMFDEIIQKLKADRYITEKHIPDAQLVYNVTFNGLLFEGYDKQHRETQRLQRTVNSLTVRTFWLTVVIAVGTFVAAVYYLFEMLNHWFCIYSK